MISINGVRIEFLTRFKVVISIIEPRLDVFEFMVFLLLQVLEPSVMYLAYFVAMFVGKCVKVKSCMTLSLFFPPYKSDLFMLAFSYSKVLGSESDVFI